MNNDKKYFHTLYNTVSLIDKSFKLNQDDFSKLLNNNPAIIDSIYNKIKPLVKNLPDLQTIKSNVLSEISVLPSGASGAPQSTEMLPEKEKMLPEEKVPQVSKGAGHIVPHKSGAPQPTTMLPEQSTMLPKQDTMLPEEDTQRMLRTMSNIDVAPASSTKVELKFGQTESKDDEKDLEELDKKAKEVFERHPDSVYEYMNKYDFVMNLNDKAKSTFEAIRKAEQEFENNPTDEGLSKYMKTIQEHKDAINYMNDLYKQLSNEEEPIKFAAIKEYNLRMIKNATGEVVNKLRNRLDKILEQSRDARLEEMKSGLIRREDREDAATIQRNALISHYTNLITQLENIQKDYLKNSSEYEKYARQLPKIVPLLEDIFKIFKYNRINDILNKPANELTDDDKLLLQVEALDNLYHQYANMSTSEKLYGSLFQLPAYMFLVRFGLEYLGGAAVKKAAETGATKLIEKLGGAELAKLSETGLKELVKGEMKLLPKAALGKLLIKVPASIAGMTTASISGIPSVIARSQEVALSNLFQDINLSSVGDADKIFESIDRESKDSKFLKEIPPQALNNVIDYITESWGVMVDEPYQLIKRAAFGNYIKKYGLSSVQDAWTKFKKSVLFDNFIGEYWEEVASQLLTSSILEGKPKYFTPEENLILAITLLVPGTVQSMATYPHIRARKKLYKTLTYVNSDFVSDLKDRYVAKYGETESIKDGDDAAFMDELVSSENGIQVVKDYINDYVTIEGIENNITNTLKTLKSINVESLYDFIPKGMKEAQKIILVSQILNNLLEKGVLIENPDGTYSIPPPAEQPPAEPPPAEQPPVQQPPAQQPPAEPPPAEPPPSEQPPPQPPAQPQVEQPQAEQPQAEQPQVEQQQIKESTEEELAVEKEERAKGYNTQIKTVNNTDVDIGTIGENDEYKGYREKGEKIGMDGSTIKRNDKILVEPSESVALGRDADVLFSDRIVVQNAKYVVVDIDEVPLEPSHTEMGQNQKHFIPEAQPKARSLIGEATRLQPTKIAQELVPTAMILGGTAYEGSPIVNTRGEVIQGNGRMLALKIYWQTNPNDTREYKETLKEYASALGISPNSIDKMKKPVLVRVVDVSDNEAIYLGQFTVDNIESAKADSVIQSQIKAIDKSTLNIIVNLLRKVIESTEEDLTLSEILQYVGAEILLLLRDKGYVPYNISDLYLYSNDRLNGAGIDYMRKLLIGLLFVGTPQEIPELYNNLPVKTKIWVEKSLPYLLIMRDVIIKDFVKAIQNYYKWEKSSNVVPLNSNKETIIKSIVGFLANPNIFSGKSIKDEESKMAMLLLYAIIKPLPAAEMVKTMQRLSSLIVQSDQLDLFNLEQKALSVFEGLKYVFKEVYDKFEAQIFEMDTPATEISAENKNKQIDTGVDTKKGLKSTDNKIFRSDINEDDFTDFSYTDEQKNKERYEKIRNLAGSLIERGVYSFESFVRVLYTFIQDKLNEPGVPQLALKAFIDAAEYLFKVTSEIENIEEQKAIELINNIINEYQKEELNDADRQRIRESIIQKEREIQSDGISQLVYFTFADRLQAFNARTTGGNVGTEQSGIRILNEDILPVVNERTPQRYSESLMPHQKDAVNRILSAFYDFMKSTFLLAFAEGTGKTRVALATATEVAEKSGKKVLIITPKKVLATYEREAKAMGVDTSNIDIITWDDLSRGKVSKERGGTELKNLDYELIIYDESHKLKNITSNRNININNITSRLSIYMTGTPFDNLTSAIFFLSKMLNQSIEEVGKMVGISISIGTNILGGKSIVMKTADNISIRDIRDKINSIIRQLTENGQYLRAEIPYKGSILPEFVALSEDNKELIAQIEKFWDGKIAEAKSHPSYKYMIKAAKEKYDAGKISEKELNELIMIATNSTFKNSDVPLEYSLSNSEAQKLREVSVVTELAKIDETIKLIQKELKSHRKVVIFSESVNPTVLQGLRDNNNPDGVEMPGFLTELNRRLDELGIRVAQVYGGGNTANEVKKFQNNEVDVALVTPGAGAEGIDLDDQVGDKPRTLILITPPYSGDKASQLFYRVSRLKTKSNAKAIVILAPDSLSDRHRAGKLIRKLYLLNAAQGGISSEAIAQELKEVLTGKQPTQIKVFEYKRSENYIVYIFFGKTYAYRNQIKSMGGIYDSYNKCWYFTNKEKAIEAYKKIFNTDEVDIKTITNLSELTADYNYNDINNAINNAKSEEEKSNLAKMLMSKLSGDIYTLQSLENYRQKILDDYDNYEDADILLAEIDQEIENINNSIRVIKSRPGELLEEYGLKLNEIEAEMLFATLGVDYKVGADYNTLDRTAIEKIAQFYGILTEDLINVIWDFSDYTPSILFQRKDRDGSGRKRLGFNRKLKQKFDGAVLQTINGLINAVKSDFKKKTGRDIDINVAENSGNITKGEITLIQQLETILGMKVVFIESNISGLNGFYKDKYLFVNVNTQDSPLYVIMHEYMHNIQRTQPELYNKIKEIFLKHIADEQNVKELYANNPVYRAGDAWLNEAIADFVAYQVDDIKFWEKLFGEDIVFANSLLNSIRSYLRDILTRISEAFKGRKITLEKYIKDREELLAHISLILNGHINQNVLNELSQDYNTIINGNTDYLYIVSEEIIPEFEGRIYQGIYDLYFHIIDNDKIILRNDFYDEYIHIMELYESRLTELERSNLSERYFKSYRGLNAVLHNDLLFTLFPELTNMPLFLVYMPLEYAMALYYGNGYIKLVMNRLYPAQYLLEHRNKGREEGRQNLKEILLHEVQHHLTERKLIKKYGGTSYKILTDTVQILRESEIMEYIIDRLYSITDRENISDYNSFKQLINQTKSQANNILDMIFIGEDNQLIISNYEEIEGRYRIIDRLVSILLVNAFGYYGIDDLRTIDYYNIIIRKIIQSPYYLFNIHEIMSYSAEVFKSRPRNIPRRHKAIIKALKSSILGGDIYNFLTEMDSERNAPDSIFFWNGIYNNIKNHINVIANRLSEVFPTIRRAELIQLVLNQVRDELEIWGRLINEQKYIQNKYRFLHLNTTETDYSFTPSEGEITLPKQWGSTVKKKFDIDIENEHWLSIFTYIHRNNIPAIVDNKEKLKKYLIKQINDIITSIETNEDKYVPVKMNQAFINIIKQELKMLKDSGNLEAIDDVDDFAEYIIQKNGEYLFEQYQNIIREDLYGYYDYLKNYQDETYNEFVELDRIAFDYLLITNMLKYIYNGKNYYKRTSETIRGYMPIVRELANEVYKNKTYQFILENYIQKINTILNEYIYKRYITIDGQTNNNYKWLLIDNSRSSEAYIDFALLSMETTWCSQSLSQAYEILQRNRVYILMDNNRPEVAIVFDIVNDNIRIEQIVGNTPTQRIDDKYIDEVKAFLAKEIGMEYGKYQYNIEMLKQDVDKYALYRKVKNIIEDIKNKRYDDIEFINVIYEADKLNIESYQNVIDELNKSVHLLKNNDDLGIDELKSKLNILLLIVYTADEIMFKYDYQTFYSIIEDTINKIAEMEGYGKGEYAVLLSGVYENIDENNISNYRKIYINSSYDFNRWSNLKNIEIIPINFSIDDFKRRGERNYEFYYDNMDNIPHIYNNPQYRNSLSIKLGRGKHFYINEIINIDNLWVMNNWVSKDNERLKVSFNNDIAVNRVSIRDLEIIGDKSKVIADDYEFINTDGINIEKNQINDLTLEMCRNVNVKANERIDSLRIIDNDEPLRMKDIKIGCPNIKSILIEVEYGKPTTEIPYEFNLKDIIIQDNSNIRGVYINHQKIDNNIHKYNFGNNKIEKIKFYTHEYKIPNTEITNVNCDFLFLSRIDNITISGIAKYIEIENTDKVDIKNTICNKIVAHPYDYYEANIIIDVNNKLRELEVYGYQHYSETNIHKIDDKGCKLLKTGNSVRDNINFIGYDIKPFVLEKRNKYEINIDNYDNVDIDYNYVDDSKRYIENIKSVNDIIAIGEEGKKLVTDARMFRFPKLHKLSTIMGDKIYFAKTTLDYKENILLDKIHKYSVQLYNELYDLIKPTYKRTGFEKIEFIFRLKNRHIVKEFMNMALPLSSFLNAVGKDENGNFIFETFMQRAGIITPRQLQKYEKELGVELKKGDRVQIVNKILTMAQAIKTLRNKGIDSKHKDFRRLLREEMKNNPIVEDLILGEEINVNGKKSYQLYRYVDDKTQEIIYNEFANMYPELITFIDLFIDPAGKDKTIEIEGVRIPVFNRYALAELYKNTGTLNEIPAYTPDIIVNRSLIGAIHSIMQGLRRGTLSPGRKYKTGVARESGNVRDLISGFSIRTFQAMKESIRREFVNEIIQSAIPYKIDAPIPEGYVSFETGTRIIYDAIKQIESMRFKPYKVKLTETEVEEILEGIKKLPYNAISFNPDEKTMTIQPFIEIIERMTKDIETDDLWFKKFLGEAYKLIGRNYIIRKDIIDVLLLQYSNKVITDSLLGKLIRLMEIIIKNSVTALIIHPITFVGNYLLNELMMMEYLARQTLAGILKIFKYGISENESLQIAKQIFINNVRFRLMPLQKALKTKKAQILQDIFPDYVFAGNIFLKDLGLDLRLRVVQDYNYAGYLLQLLNYHKIDIRAKQRVAMSVLIGLLKKDGIINSIDDLYQLAINRNIDQKYITRAIQIANFELLNYDDAPIMIQNMVRNTMTRLFVLFPLFGYSFLSKQYDNIISLMNIFRKVDTDKKIDSVAAALMTFIFSMGGAGMLYVVLFGDDEDEDIRRIMGSSQVLQEIDGKIVRKTVPPALNTANRIKISNFFIDWLDTNNFDTNETEYWLRVRTLFPIAMLAAGAQAYYDTKHYGVKEGVKTYLTAAFDLLTDFISLGGATRVMGKVMQEYDVTEDNIFDKYGNNVPMVFYMVDNAMDMFVPGGRIYDEVILWVDPIYRRSSSVLSMDYNVSYTDQLVNALKFSHITGLVSRLIEGESDLMPKGTIRSVKFDVEKLLSEPKTLQGTMDKFKYISKLFEAQGALTSGIAVMEGEDLRPTIKYLDKNTIPTIQKWQRIMRLLGLNIKEYSTEELEKLYIRENKYLKEREKLIKKYVR